MKNGVAAHQMLRDATREEVALHHFTKMMRGARSDAGLTLREMSDSDSDDEDVPKKAPTRFRDLMGAMLEREAPMAMVDAWIAFGIECMMNDPCNGVVAEGLVAVLSLHSNPEQPLTSAMPRYGEVRGHGHPEALLLKQYVALGLIFCEHPLIEALVDAPERKGPLRKWGLAYESGGPRHPQASRVPPRDAALSKLYQFRCIFRSDWNQHLVRLPSAAYAARADEIRDTVERARNLWKAEGWSQRFSRRDDPFEIFMLQNKK